MIKSMTAYAKSERVAESLTISTEIRSYNSRYLDIALRLSHGYAQLEERIKKLIAMHLSRGRIEINIGIKDQTEAEIAYEADLPRARAYFSALSALKEEVKLPSAIGFEHLLNGGGMIKPVEVEKNIDDCWPLVSECLLAALMELDQMRRKEGAFIAADFTRRLTGIEASLAKIRKAAEGLLSFYRDRLIERINALAKGIAAIEPERIALEAAILADKSDISEEILRAESHMQQYRALMATDTPAGTKLNFLLQEFNREFNTMGSKSAKSEVSHIIVDVKAEIEKLREQVQNVE
jgi:uncharacterized protein (TIGR00255 family)